MVELIASEVEWNAFAAVAAAASAIIATVATTFNYLLVRAQLRAEVIVYTKVDVSRPLSLLLVVENIGKGVARNITFTSDRPIPFQAFHGVAEVDREFPLTARAIVAGMPALQPGGDRTYLMGDFAGLSQIMANKPIKIVARYESSYLSTRLPSVIETESMIEVESYRLTDARRDDSGMKTLTDQLRQMTNALDDHFRQNRL